MPKSVFQQLVEQTCSNANFKPSNNKVARSAVAGAKPVANGSAKSVGNPNGSAPRSHQQPARTAAADRAARCHHVKANGVQCKSPAMRGQPFCFFHEKFYNPPYDDCFPPLEDANSVQCAILQVLNGLKSKLITPLEARVYLYGLKAASINARRTNFETVQDQVTEHPAGRRPEPTIPGLEEHRNLAGIAPSEGHSFSRDETRPVKIGSTASSAAIAASESHATTFSELNCHPESAAAGEGPAVAVRARHGFSRDKKEPSAVRTARSASPSAVVALTSN